MPRTTEEILAHADELASRFENDFEPTDSSAVDALDGLSKAVVEAAKAEKNVRLWVQQSRAQGKSWGAIGGVLGTTGEAARQRYTPTKGAPKKMASAAKKAPAKTILAKNAAAKKRAAAR